MFPKSRMDRLIPRITICTRRPRTCIHDPFHFLPSPLTRPIPYPPCHSQAWVFPSLWRAIIDVLSFDAYSLLACCFTCRSFNDLARWKLSRLSFQILDGRPENGRLITEQIQKISTSARCIRNLIVRNSHMMASAVILAVPFKLPSQLTNLQRLTLINISDTSSIHPSVWPLFGDHQKKAIL